MLPEKEKGIIIEFAKKYKISSIYLFGSSVTSYSDAWDIDIGVKGLAPEKFFSFYAELYKYLPKPVDLVDLSRKSKIVDLIEREGIKIYG